MGTVRSWIYQGRRDRSELQSVTSDFLPAALAVQHRPPSPIGRWLTWALITLFMIGVLWACFGRVDIVVSAPGRIIPSGHVKVVQAPEAGTITAIHVQDGQHVNQGEIVVELDATYASADDRQLRESIEDNEMHQSWRHIYGNWLQAREHVEDTQAQSTSSTVALETTAERLLSHHQAEFLARQLELSKEKSALTAQLHGAIAEEEKARAVLSVLNERVEAYEKLLEKQYSARSQYLEIKQQQVDLRRSLPPLTEQQEQLRHRIQGVAARLSSILAEYQKANLLELARLQTELRSQTQELLKAEKRHTQHELRAPVSGTVQELQVHTLGGVVNASEELMRIVPRDAIVEVEALVQNKDIGFLVEGQQASVKIDTFNFTKYGYIDATVLDISDDVVEHPDLGWVFKMKLALGADQIQIGDRLVGLSPGMTVISEVKTGQRRLIEYFLSPLLRYKQESIRER